VANDVFQNVLAFHSKLCPDQFQPLPDWPSDAILQLRKDLLEEEFQEVLVAIEQRDIVKLADGLADLEYVLNGFAIACGIDLRRVNAAVQKANMRKIGGPTRHDGKILKPEGWEHPNIAAILWNQPKLRMIEFIEEGQQCTSQFAGHNCGLKLGHTGYHLSAESETFSWRNEDEGEGWEG
jgi:predicted HAD superfamily Cof-like phosphohydrolase